jgi:hypothetical protein
MLTGWWSLKILLDCIDTGNEVGGILIPYFKLFTLHNVKSIDKLHPIFSKCFLYFFYKSWHRF